ncbi:NAD(+) diphosphatase [Qipengyuania sp. XHP0207]|uniref:NAD(+) diphosphatase n=1 Tax=Qipengyuania sp. XHP0207 TaxID=3038078 RepID=UPI00241DE812|nr:NAD(+) diphosphatase [Qipengyuania sp. XHP0207]MDG5747078.1 NAD(+) diphosphatase [Qipengyuania sp. XHP0207]
MSTLPLAFTGSRLDRADHVRADPERLAGYMNWKARLLALDGLMPALDDEGRLAWGTLADVPEDAELCFLGLDDGKACFAAVPPRGDASPRMANPQLWSLMATLAPDDLALYGGARSLTDWHARHRFCAECGGDTKIAKGGWQRECTNCGANHFPRTDPVTIMLVEFEGKLMLGRGLGWPEGSFSALAGFVEPGESIEEAVAREVLEEAGIAVRDVSYIASQPWPFPSQLMIGCHSHADSDDMTIDETEMAEINFYTREEVEAALKGNGPFRCPPRHAIAHHLMEWWVNQ